MSHCAHSLLLGAAGEDLDDDHAVWSGALLAKRGLAVPDGHARDVSGLKLVLSPSYTLKESFGIMGFWFFSINDQMFVWRKLGF